jgi:ribosomal protein S18 acetylase RimI-like enzyme
MVLYAEKGACQAGGWLMGIRRAVAGDSLLLSRLSVDVQRLHAENHPHVFKMPVEEGYAISFFADMLADPTVSILIAEEAGNAMGYLLCKLVERPDTPFTFAARILLVDQISVRPEAQGKGIGESLIKQAEHVARELKAERMVLDSWDFNLSAHAFFERRGFRKFMFRFWQHL